MRDIRQIFQLAGQNFSGWKSNPRIVMTFLLAFVLCLLLSDEVLTYSRRYETSLQILEPFIWTYGDAMSVMLSSLLLVLLYADMPFVNQETPYRLIRTKRSVWLAGQLVSLFIASVMLCLNLLIGNAAGVIGAFAVNLYGFLLNPNLFQKLFHLTENQLYRANVLCGWLSPLNHATFPMHNFGYDYLPKISMSIGIFLAAIILLMILSGMKMQTYSFTFIQMDE